MFIFLYYKDLFLNIFKKLFYNDFVSESQGRFFNIERKIYKTNLLKAQTLLVSTAHTSHNQEISLNRCDIQFDLKFYSN